MRENLFSIFASMEDCRNHAPQMSIIADALLALASDEFFQRLFPEIEQAAYAFTNAIGEGDPERVEIGLACLYTLLHCAGQNYSEAERRRLQQHSGYSCYASGFSPLLYARDFVRPQTISADLGAGNGLQGLLLQKLYPHHRTIQIELSRSLIETGLHFQRTLGIGEQRVEWIHADLAETSFDRADFIYLYRPARPQGGGRELYRSIARRLNKCPGPLVVFSVADCLGQFLDARFTVFYSDGHLTCFRK
jgi:hypothetical protein